MKIFQLILSPLSLLYQFILRIRNLFYDKGILGVTSFDIPTISVGNLAFGGTGKTPHIEYLIKHLSPNFKVAVLSRGYKRKTIGYVFANQNCSALSIGDEPYQLFDKFNNIAVAVSENRVLGIPDLLFDAPETQVILLDDAYQHRALKPGLNILLSDYSNRFTTDYLAPAGMLREYAAAYVRADIIVVSKCPPELNMLERHKIISEIKPFPHQKIYFSYLTYGVLTGLYQLQNLPENLTHALVFTGIANPQKLLQELESKGIKVSLKQYTDHYHYQQKDAEDIAYLFANIQASNKIIITTEKDKTKLMNEDIRPILEKLPLFYLPVEVNFFEPDKTAFDKQVYEYVSTNTANH